MHRSINKFMSGFSEGTTWSRKGQCVIAAYLDIPIQGEIIESRVKYGGKIQHSIVISEDITLDWNGEVRKCGTILLIGEDDVKSVFIN